MFFVQPVICTAFPMIDVSLFGWLAEVFGLSAVWVAARSPYGWLLGVVSSICWIIYGFAIASTPLIVGSFIYTGVNVASWVRDNRRGLTRP